MSEADRVQQPDNRPCLPKEERFQCRHDSKDYAVVILDDALAYMCCRLALRKFRVLLRLPHRPPKWNLF